MAADDVPAPHDVNDVRPPRGGLKRKNTLSAGVSAVRRASQSEHSLNDLRVKYAANEEHSAEDKALLLRAIEHIEPIAALPSMLKSLLVDAFALADAAAGQTVLKAGAPSTTLYVVRSGTFRITSKFDTTTLLRGQCERGASMGEQAIYEHENAVPSGHTIACLESGQLFTLTRQAYSDVHAAAVRAWGVAEHAENFLSHMQASGAPSKAIWGKALKAYKAQAELPTRAQLTTLAEHTQMVTVDAGDVILSRETPAERAILFIKAGSLSIELPRAEKVRAPTLTFSAGDVVCEQDLADFVFSTHEGSRTFDAKGEVAYLRLPALVREAEPDVVPTRVEWVAANALPLKLLRSMPAFRDLNESELEDLFRRGTVLHYREGELVNNAEEEAVARTSQAERTSQTGRSSQVGRTSQGERTSQAPSAAFARRSNRRRSVRSSTASVALLVVLRGRALAKVHSPRGVMEVKARSQQRRHHTQLEFHVGEHIGAHHIVHPQLDSFADYHAGKGGARCQPAHSNSLPARTQ